MQQPEAAIIMIVQSNPDTAIAIIAMTVKTRTSRRAPSPNTSLSLSLGLILACAFAQPSLAQSVPNSRSQGFQNNEIDNFTGIEQGTFNPMDIIHRASMGPQRTLGEFRQEGQQQLNNAAEKFRLQQLELLQQQRLNRSNVLTPHEDSFLGAP
ncbi:MAG: hypothetical protein SVX43_02630 [Cyanobacteriota bacterium]|nr:hypothetical protein [Cyanobacteriota bacterium]